VFWRDQHGGNRKVFLPVRLRRFRRQIRNHRCCPVPRNRAKASLSAPE
jgi:hypothetical protein